MLLLPATTDKVEGSAQASSTQAAPAITGSVDTHSWMAAIEAAQRAEQDYSRRLARALSTSVDARDRALATQVKWMVSFQVYEFALDPAERASALSAAAQAGPDDPLVQWIWAVATDAASGCGKNPACAHRPEALARIQPNNAAAWLPAFYSAWQSGDVVAADGFLGHMAQAQHFDDLQGEAMRAWRDVYRRYPWPRETVVPGSQGDAEGPDIMEFGRSRSAAFAVRLFDSGRLEDACNRTKHPDTPAARFQECAKVARLMLSDASLEWGSTAAKLLRGSREASAADVDAVRGALWLHQSAIRLQMSHPFADNTFAELAGFSKDWQETGSETEVVKRQLSRAGIALVPPVGWHPSDEHGQPLDPLDARW